MEDLLEKIRSVVTEVVDIDPQKIQPDANLREDLEIDSLARVEIVMAIEDVFKIQIDESHAGDIKFVKDLMELVTKLQKT